MSGKGALSDIQGRMHRSLGQSIISMRKRGRSYERRMHLAPRLVRRRQPHLGEPEALKVRNRLLEKVPPT